MKLNKAHFVCFALLAAAVALNLLAQTVWSTSSQPASQAVAVR